MGVRIANRAPQFLPGTTIADASSQAVYAFGPMVTAMVFDGVIVNNSCLAKPHFLIVSSSRNLNRKRLITTP